MSATDPRRGKRERGDCPVCGRVVPLTGDGIPYRHKHATRGDFCLGDLCVGKYPSMSLERALLLQTHEADYRLWLLEEIFNGRPDASELPARSQHAAGKT